MAEVRIPVERLAHGIDLPLPAYATTGAAGLDLLAAVPEPVTIEPLARALIPTGICLALPAGFEGQVRPRSGLALRHGVTVLNGPGTIDPDYRGEVGVILINLGAVSFMVARGAAIAQLVVAPVVRVGWIELPVDPNATGRGRDGFGSTGGGGSGVDGGKEGGVG